MDSKGFVFEDHTADVKARCFGKDLEEAYEQAAYSLMYTISPNLEKISQKRKKEIKVTSEDKEALLFDFLSELLYIFDVDKLLFSKINIKHIKKIDDGYELNSILFGEKFDKGHHEIGTEVKAITYSYMNIEKKQHGFEIEIVFDI